MFSLLLTRLTQYCAHSNATKTINKRSKQLLRTTQTSMESEFHSFYDLPTRYSILQFRNIPVVLRFIQRHFFSYMHNILAFACGKERKL
jgi:hypothetical protein